MKDEDSARYAEGKRLIEKRTRGHNFRGISRAESVKDVEGVVL